MDNNPVYLRSIEAVVEGVVFSDALFNDEWPSTLSLRLFAVIDVLRRLDVEIYDQIVEAAFDFNWFIPEHDMRAILRSFVASPASLEKYDRAIEAEDAVRAAKELVGETTGPTTFSSSTLKPQAYVIFLAPALEETAWDVVVGVVAYQLARILSGYCRHVNNFEEYEGNKKEAMSVAAEWGFGREIRKLKSEIEAKDAGWEV